MLSKVLEKKMIINNNLIDVKKPKSMLLSEIDYYKKMKDETDSIAEKIKLETKILELSLQLKNDNQ